MGLLTDFSPAGIVEKLAESTVGKVVAKILDFIPDPQQKADLMVKLRELDLEDAKQAATEAMQQLAINLEDAKRARWITAREAFMWCGVAAFGYKFVVQPFLVFLVVVFWPTWSGFSKLPELDWTTMATIVIPLLGISSHKSSESQAIIAAKQ